VKFSLGRRCAPTQIQTQIPRWCSHGFVHGGGVFDRMMDALPKIRHDRPGAIPCESDNRQQDRHEHEPSALLGSFIFFGRRYHNRLRG
jgi:hypothetical protein